MYLYTVGSGVLEDDAVSIHAGKDFALMRTLSGKVIIGVVVVEFNCCSNLLVSLTSGSLCRVVS